jgi:hypothetical protein
VVGPVELLRGVVCFVLKEKGRQGWQLMWERTEGTKAALDMLAAREAV